MKPESSAGSWLKFFTAAGINTAQAEHYAVTFSKNQIQLDMLPEINKEYLNDMGITLLGHIIAILRHAKTVYADEMKKSELSTSKKQGVISPKDKTFVKTSKTTTTNKAVAIEAEKTSSSPPKRKSSVLQLPVETTEPKTKVRKTLCDSSDDITLPKTKTVTPTIVRNSISDISPSDEMRKGVFKRLGSEIGQTPPEVETSPSGGNGESVFARLGGKTNAPQVAKVAALASTKRLMIAKEESSAKTIPRKSIIRTRLDKPRIPSSAHMDSVNAVVSPTYMDRLLDERKQSAKLVSSTSGMLSEKRDIRARLGFSSAKLENSKVCGNGKKVSFGSVYQKLIPRVTKQPSFRSNLNTGQNISIGASPLSPTRFSIGCSSNLRSLSMASSPGVFSRLGT